MEKDRTSKVKLGHNATNSKVESGAKLVHSISWSSDHLEQI